MVMKLDGFAVALYSAIKRELLDQTQKCGYVARSKQ